MVAVADLGLLLIPSSFGYLRASSARECGKSAKVYAVDDELANETYYLAGDIVIFWTC